MELRAGYKQTEVGVIPEDWGVYKVSEQFDIQLGKMLDAEKNIGIHKPYIGNRSVQWNRIDATELPTMAMSAVDLQRYRLNKGDLLVCEGGEVGRAAIWDGQIAECYYQKALHRLRPIRGFDTRLMVGLLRYWVDHGYLMNFVSQTSIAHLTREKFADVPMAVPSCDEQSAIATALSDVDALLAKIDQLIAKKRDLKQAAMQQLLTGQTRLPGFSGEWEVKRLGDLFAFSGGHTASRDQLSNSGCCYLHYGDIHKSIKTFIDLEAEYLDIPKLTVRLRDVPPSSMLKNGDVVFVDASEDDEGTSRHVVVVNPLGQPYISGLHTIVAKAKGDFLDNGFKRFCFQTRSIKQQFQFFAVGTKVSGISKTSIAKIELSFPPLAEQTAIATVLSDMDAELAALETRRDKTRALKQGMMQALLTGRIRLIAGN
jgi:type I restriction enzyme S subunit